MPKFRNDTRNQNEITEQPSESIQSQSEQDLFPFSKIIKSSEENILHKLYKLYLYQGPSWKLIKNELNQELKDPKNFIYNAIRKSAKTLAKYEMKILVKSKRRLISKDTLLSLLQIVNQIQKEIISRNLTLNQESQLFKFKKTLLRFSLWENSLSDDQICYLIRIMKEINLKFRCLSIFKAKRRGDWKISEKALELISSFDKITVQRPLEFENSFAQLQVDPFEKNTELELIQEEDDILNESLQQLDSLLMKERKKRWKAEKTLEEEVNQILNIRKTDLNILQKLL